MRELIACPRASAGRRWWTRGDQHGDGCGDCALLPHDAAEVIAAARARGLSYQGPQAGGRIRPDGARLEWQLGIPTSNDLPFLCGDITPRGLRVRETDEHGRDVRVHANGVSGVAEIRIAVRHLEQSLARYAALLGHDDPAASSTIVAQPGTGLRSATLPLSASTRVVLLSPDASPDKLTVAVSQHLATRGEGVFGVTLRAAPGSAAAVLDAQLSHGARFEVAPQ